MRSIVQNLAAPQLVAPPSETDTNLRPSSFERVYVECFHEVSRWARAMGGKEEDLDDLAQEVFLVVRRKLDEFDGRNLRGWLYRITQRTVRDYRRSAWFRNLLSLRRGDDSERRLHGLVEPGPGPAERLERREAERALSSIVGRMREKQRTVFVLFEIEGYTGEEIAELEGVSVNTIWTRLHHARKDFADIVRRLRQERRFE
jgi:RNA polymerase sigma-70 factor (ECF subfamily)